MNNSNKRILITGSSRGIGKAIALRLAESGYQVVVHYRQGQQQAESVVSQLTEAGLSATLLQFDISDRDQCEAVLTEDISLHGVYYGVVCNAGLTADNAFPAMTDSDWDQVIHTNLDGFYNVLKPLTMPMVQNRKPGRIVTMASVSGLIGNRGQVNYSAAKAGIIGATKALAIELAKRKITVNCVAPGLIDTDMTDDLPVTEIVKQIPARRVGKPEEVASLVNYLMSEDAAYITRQVISVNGGLC
ncbi:3-oxoacyl-ACP reductase FabG [Spartinivicinus poritis]|uniref:3-oxoacyl-ACP reductase FabG n=1 Tax=Spartinivicinus poritis TaxID=2994640 RepID=A0ABT5U4F2_9GAMM|nr:3-oxoacyl-ACP reductase FabG [Spartinivicinus sp. A2-2]MDE1460348.1 3-oxoacyl-ACP reductase FabG [Spartinivicinus sp. A2-2]